MRRGKPYIASIYSHNGKTIKIPVRATYRELLDCIKVLGIKSAKDEMEMEILGYETIYLRDLEKDTPYSLVEHTDEMLGGLTQEQAELVIKTCEAFELPFRDVSLLIRDLQDYQSKSEGCEDEYYS
jgi:hypothetical protein